MKEITVLMSTYNGEMFIREQIDSILNSKDVELQLLVRDDGSSDQTIPILKSYQTQKKLSFYQGHNVRPAKSFMELLCKAPSSKYYAFSDQDDYWSQDKLSIAINCIKSYGQEPALYFCQTQLVDKDLNPMKNIYINPRLTFGEALTYQFIGGCTMVLNRSLRDIIIKYTPNYQPMHDVWIYSIAQAIGAHIFFDPKPHILYHQHSHNAIGQGYSRFKEWKRRWKRISNSEHERLKRAKELKIGYYKMMSKENKSILDKAILSGEGNLWQRIIASSDKRLKCSSKTTYVLFRLSAIFKTF